MHYANSNVNKVNIHNRLIPKHSVVAASGVLHPTCYYHWRKSSRKINIMKVICAGAPKTGTKSLAKALRILGYDAVYDAEEAMEFAFKEWEDVWESREPNLKVMLETVYSNNVEAVVDCPHSLFFDHFLEHWPDAKVILMLRDEDDWFRSFKQMSDRMTKKYWYARILQNVSPTLNRMLTWHVSLFTASVGSVKPHPFLWKRWYRRHNKYVKETVPSSQLLEYRVTEGWKPLCEFLGKPIPQQEFPLENRAGIPHDIADTVMQDVWIAKKAARELTVIFALLPLSVAIICSLYFYFY